MRIKKLPNSGHFSRKSHNPAVSSEKTVGDNAQPRGRGVRRAFLPTA
jgi:hypothetical protein